MRRGFRTQTCNMNGATECWGCRSNGHGPCKQINLEKKKLYARITPYRRGRRRKSLCCAMRRHTGARLRPLIEKKAEIQGKSELATGVRRPGQIAAGNVSTTRVLQRPHPPFKRENTYVLPRQHSKGTRTALWPTRYYLL